MLAVGDVAAQALSLGEQLHQACGGLRIQRHCGGGSVKSQMKKADRSGAEIALILGEDEVAAGQVTVKYLRGQAEQQTLDVAAVIELLQREFA